jgi:molybdenum cofactor guanylyltransferase
MRDDLAVVLLAGGLSRRMGRTKALLEVPGGTVISRLSQVCRQVADMVVVSANDRQAFESLGLPVILDLHPGSGPMAGIHSAMLHSCRPHVLAVATDMPNVTVATLELIASSIGSYDVALPRTPDGIYHPLCAVYKRSLLPSIEERLVSGRNRLLELVFASRHVALTKGFNELDLANWNTPEDLRS